MFIYKDDARRMLPQVGDKRRETPTTVAEKDDRRARECEVVYVNERHLWYMVRYNSGICESFKVPRVRAGQP